MNNKQFIGLDRASVWRLWLGWVLANAIGGGVGWLIAPFVGIAIYLGVGLIAVGTIVGFCLGIAQWKFLERYIPDRNWSRWVIYTTIGGTIVWIFAISMSALLVSLNDDFLLDPIHPIIVFSMGGSILGIAQWLVLRRHIRNAAWWIPSNAVGWSIGAFIGLRVGHEVSKSIPGKGSIIFSPMDGIEFFVAGAVGTVVFGIITGITMIWLVRVSNVKPKADAHL